VLLAGCGGDSESPEAAAAIEPFRFNMRTATCTDWKRSTPPERRSAVDRLERIVAGPRMEGNTLPDDVAYNTLDARCEPYLARAFLLYELYTRAAAFESVSE
jgi:hypothetical protein